MSVHIMLFIVAVEYMRDADVVKGNTRTEKP